MAGQSNRHAPGHQERKRQGPSDNKPVLAGSAGDLTPEPKYFLGVHPNTWKKILPLGLMFFCILFNYTILRDTKDVLVVTAPGSGAEIIPFLKTWVNLPLAVGFTVLYSKMSNVLSTESLFYAVIFPFIIFFGAFAFVLYPMTEMLHPTEFCQKLLETAELWGSVVVSVLFWGFANQITTVDEAKQFYPLFGLGANVALIFSGRAVVYFSNVRAKLPPGVDGWGYSLRGMMSMVVVGGLIVAGTYYLMNRFVIPNVETPDKKKGKKKKEYMSVGDSIKFLAKSAYVRSLATLVVAYGISINLVEVTWKGKIKAQFPNPNDYSSFMGDFSTATGAVTFIMMLVSRIIFRKYGWTVAALITPSVLLVTGIAFFTLVLASGPLTPALAAIGMTPLLAAVYVGAAQNIFSKSAKYSLFDPCKEMAYIPLDEETKVKGKAAIDVICNPLGKSGGALIQQFLIVGFGSLAASTPVLAVVLFAIVGAWIKSATFLGTQFGELTKEEEIAGP
eukprot:jgi/Pico_ML_1/55667/g1324.t1